MNVPTVSIVVATYEWPEALDLVLRALHEETDASVDVVVADDGSGPTTTATVERWTAIFGERLRYARQDDEGWRQARIRNLGALHAQGDFLVFLDGDCLVRPGFLRAVRRAATPGRFLGSKRLHLSQELSTRVLQERLPVWRRSVAGWLLRSPRELFSSHREAGRPGVLLPLRDRRLPWQEHERDFVPPYDAYGFFFGVSRDDFERTNGFDMRFEGWGGEDVDLAARLRIHGLTCCWPGPSATMIHLWHLPRKARSNAALLAETHASSHIRATFGLRELETELHAEAAG
jgi:GT2 family glycosyltransferase